MDLEQQDIIDADMEQPVALEAALAAEEEALDAELQSIAADITRQLEEVMQADKANMEMAA